MIIVISSLLFKMSPEVLSNSLDLKNFLVIQTVLLIAIGLSSVQAISFQRIFKNNILSTSFFILINYVLALIFLQLRYFSRIIEVFTYLFPMSLVSYFYKSNIDLKSYSIISLAILVLTLMITTLVINVKEKNEFN